MDDIKDLIGKRCKAFLPGGETVTGTLVGSSDNMVCLSDVVCKRSDGTEHSLVAVCISLSHCGVGEDKQ